CYQAITRVMTKLETSFDELWSFREERSASMSRRCWRTMMLSSHWSRSMHSESGFRDPSRRCTSGEYRMERSLSSASIKETSSAKIAFGPKQTNLANGWSPPNFLPTLTQERMSRELPPEAGVRVETFAL